MGELGRTARTERILSNFGSLGEEDPLADYPG